MSVTRKVPPTSAVAGGSSTEVTTRSGGGGLTWTVEDPARQLLVSSLSTITAVSSAQASRWYVAGGVVAGMVRTTLPLEAVPAARAGTARAPLSRTSPAVFAEALKTSCRLPAESGRSAG